MHKGLNAMVAGVALEVGILAGSAIGATVDAALATWDQNATPPKTSPNYATSYPEWAGWASSRGWSSGYADVIWVNTPSVSTRGADGSSRSPISSASPGGLTFDGDEVTEEIIVEGNRGWLAAKSARLGGAFVKNFKFRFRTTNDFFFSGSTRVTRTFVGLLTSGGAARAFGTVTPIQAIVSIVNPGLGPAGIATLGGVAGTIGSAVLHMGLNALVAGAALEVGIIAGSALGAIVDSAIEMRE